MFGTVIFYRQRFLKFGALLEIGFHILEVLGQLRKSFQSILNVYITFSMRILYINSSGESAGDIRLK